MLKNYIRIAWRNLIKGKAYSAINIIGLATGMAITLLIGLWIADEISFDSYHTQHDRLAQVMVTQITKDENSTFPVVSMPMGQALRTKYPDDITRVALTSFAEEDILAAGDKKISGSGCWTQWEFPEMFTLHMISGDRTALKDPSTLLLSQSMATALFGNTDPINKMIRLNNKLDLKVGGVFEDLPHNTTLFSTRFLLPWNNKENSYLNSNTDWKDHNGQLYVELAPGVTAERLTEKVRHMPPQLIKGLQEEIMLQPLDKLHLYTEFRNGKASGGRIQFVWLFGIIGGFVLLLACINFMNLSTARSEKRAKEVGIRKTVGSLRKQLIGQFLSESILVAFLALILAFLLSQASLYYFNILSQKQMSIPWNSPLFWILAIGFTVFTGIVSGSYPAFYLSRFEPVKVLKGTFKAGRSASLPRQVLVVLQFSVSLILIIGTIIVFRQIQFAKDRPIGYSREGLLTVSINTPELQAHYDALRNELLHTGLVENMTASSQAITKFNSNNELFWKGKDPSDVVDFRNVNVTPDFGKTIGWTVVKGRDFSREYTTDSNAMILNEAAVKIIGIKDPIGEQVTFFGKQYTVIGVVNDLLTNSPYERIEPALFKQDGYLSVITIRVKPGTPMRTALSGIETVFKKYNPASPFVYQFSDDAYALKFGAEERISNLATVFATFAIFISCLGLFGLASFVAEQRTKELGVRKVLGAGIFTLWGMQSRDFVKLVFISLFIAIPLSWYGMHQWLQSYTYRTSMPWWIFAAASMGILLITLLTVSYQSLKAAMMNPIKSLKSE